MNKFIKTFESFVNSKGELEEFNKLIYPSKEIEETVVDPFIEEYKDYMDKQGWAIFDCDGSEYFGALYDTTDTFWQVQVIDYPEEFYGDSGNALIGITTDAEAWERAKKLGLILDEDGIIQGYNDINLVEKYNKGN